MKMQKYFIVLSETELIAWGEARLWKLPRMPMIRSMALKKVSTLFKDIGYNEIGDRKEDWILAEFLPLSRRPKKGSEIPLYCVGTIYGFDERQTLILKSRFGECGYVVDRAHEKFCAAFKKWWDDLVATKERCDIEDGLEAFPKIFLDIGTETAISNEAIVSAVQHYGDNNSNVDFLSQLFSYSREAVSKYERLIAAMCDLGIILRKRQETDEDTRKVSTLSACVQELINKSEKTTIKDIAGVLNSFAPQVEYGIEFVLFLSWKYATEAKCGKIDFEIIEEDVLSAQKASVPMVKIVDALRMFGALSGFKNFADVYHYKMRRRLKMLK